MLGSDPSARYPITGAPRTGFLRNFITRPNILVGDYTYYDDPAGPEASSRMSSTTSTSSGTGSSSRSSAPWPPRAGSS